MDARCPSRGSQDLLLRNLDAGQEIAIPYVADYSFDSTSHFLAFSRADSSGAINAVRIRDLTDSLGSEFDIVAERNGTYTHLLWSNAGDRLAFVAAVLDSNGKPGAGSLCLWNPGTGSAERIVPAGVIPSDWRLPSSNSLSWSRDGLRLLFGTKPLVEIHDEETAPEDSTIDLYNIDALLKKGEVDDRVSDQTRSRNLTLCYPWSRVLAID